MQKKRGSGLEEEAIDTIDHPKGNMSRKALEQSVRMQVRKMEHQILMKEIGSNLKQRGAAPDLLRDYQVFWLYYREGMTAKSISCIPSIGLTTKGVESLLRRLTQFVRLKMNLQRHQATLPTIAPPSS